MRVLTCAARRDLDLPQVGLERNASSERERRSRSREARASDEVARARCSRFVQGRLVASLGETVKL